MDISHRIAGFLGFDRIQGRIRTLSENLGRFSPQLWKRVFGVLLILGALGLASWAHQIARTEAIRDWELKQPPEPQVWEAVLQSRGFTRVQDPKILHSALKTLPLTLDSENSTWLTEDSAWAAVFLHGQSDDSQPWIFQRKTQDSTPPRTWTPQGKGWTGLRALVRRLDSFPTRTKPVTKAQKPAISVDPRAIQY